MNTIVPHVKQRRNSTTAESGTAAAGAASESKMPPSKQGSAKGRGLVIDTALSDDEEGSVVSDDEASRVGGVAASGAGAGAGASAGSTLKGECWQCMI